MFTEFASMNGTVILFAPLAGWLVDKLKLNRLFMSVSMACMSALAASCILRGTLLPPVLLLVGSSMWYEHCKLLLFVWFSLLLCLTFHSIQNCWEGE